MTERPDPSFPRLHGRPDSGWINDPNGLAVIDGRYHVFFQYNPDAPVHAGIHWGHISSTDLVRWHQEPIALVPRAGGPDERGCWSGCLVDDDGTPTALYTAASAAEPHGGGVALATSDRTAISWTQAESVLENSNEPLDIDVRDPYVFTFQGRRFAVQGGGCAGGTPRVLLYSCDDLRDWTFLGDLLAPDDPIAAAFGDTSVWECPNLFELDGSWVLLASPLKIGEPGLIHDEVFALVGQLEPVGDGLRFHPETASRVDSGASFYAPQVLVDGERRLLWAWTEDLGRSPAEIATTGWAGALTFPRELRLDDGRLASQPACELTGLRRERLAYHPGEELDLSAFEVVAEHGLTLRLGAAAGSAGERVASGDGPTRLLVDGSLIELFGSEAAHTTRAYPRADQRWIVDSPGPVTLWRLGLDG